ncbi:MAG: alpha/beta hydrolase [Candidatus Obscuribacterales bacterium]|nr:alpha/beta hydrolase [Candidatus Obscuribacterales bacterium]
MQQKKVFLYLHGFASSPQSSKAKFFLEKAFSESWDISIPDLNYPSFEKMTLSSQLELAKQKIKEQLSISASESLILIGSSMGGLLAALLSTELKKEISALILMAPAFALSRRWQKLWGESALERWQQNGFLELFHYGYMQDRKLERSFLDDMENHQTESVKISVPTLVLHGKSDEIVSVQESLDFERLNSDFVDLCILDDDHQLLSSLPRIWQETLRFLQKIEK